MCGKSLQLIAMSGLAVWLVVSLSVFSVCGWEWVSKISNLVIISQCCLFFLQKHLVATYRDTDTLRICAVLTQCVYGDVELLGRFAYESLFFLQQKKEKKKSGWIQPFHFEVDNLQSRFFFSWDTKVVPLHLKSDKPCFHHASVYTETGV